MISQTALEPCNMLFEELQQAPNPSALASLNP